MRYTATIFGIHQGETPDVDVLTLRVNIGSGIERRVNVPAGKYPNVRRIIDVECSHDGTNLTIVE